MCTVIFTLSLLHCSYQVKQLCGSPVLQALSTEDTPTDALSFESVSLGTDEIISMDSEMIRFLVTIENSQEFYSNIVNR